MPIYDESFRSNQREIWEIKNNDLLSVNYSAKIMLNRFDWVWQMTFYLFGLSVMFRLCFMFLNLFLNPPPFNDA